MRSTLLITLVLFGAAVVLAADTYPASFPFENEYGEGLPDLNFPEATPSYTYTSSDKGGYEHLRLKCDYAAEMAKDVLYGSDGKEIAKGRSEKGNQVLQQIKAGGTPQYLNLSTTSWTPWYCPGAQYSAKSYLLEKTQDITNVKTLCTVGRAMKVQWDNKWKAAIEAGTKKTFDGYLGVEVLPSGELGTKKDCTDCCKKFNQDDFDHLKRAGVRTWVPPTTGISTIQTFMRTDSCSISMGEASKCYIIESYNAICVQNYLSGSKRAFLYPCPDIFLRHYYSCKLRMARATVAGAPEPPLYAKMISAKQSATMSGTNRNPDKVCQPYSYYYPALRKPAGSTDYYSPGSALGSNDPSGGAPAPAGAGGSTNAPTSGAASKKLTYGVLAAIFLLARAI